MITRRIASMTAATAAVALVLAGCSTAGGESEQPTKVNMLVNITPNLTIEWWTDLIATFEEANPDIDVRLQAPPAAGVRKTLPQLLASGDIPDIVQTVTPDRDLVSELLDLSEYDWAVNGPLAEQYRIDDGYYMAGIGVQLQTTFFYNKQAFAEAGIEGVPETLEELDAAVTKLQDAGWVPFQTTGDWFSDVLFQYAGIPTVMTENPNWFADISSGDLIWSDSYREIAELYAKWVAQGAIPADAVGLKFAEAEQKFLAGEAAMYATGSWFGAAEAKATDKPEIGVFAAPAAAGVSPASVTVNIASPYIILENSNVVDEAVRVVEFLTTDQDAVVEQLTQNGNFRAGYETPVDDLGAELAAIVANIDPSAITPSGDGYGERTVPPGYAEELDVLVQGLMVGGSVDDFLAAMDAWFLANN